MRGIPTGRFAQLPWTIYLLLLLLFVRYEENVDLLTGVVRENFFLPESALLDIIDLTRGIAWRHKRLLDLMNEKHQ